MNEIGVSEEVTNIYERKLKYFIEFHSILTSYASIAVAWYFSIMVAMEWTFFLHINSIDIYAEKG